LLVSSFFLIYTILTFDKKRKRKSWCGVKELSVEAAARERI
jgi:hypothetical protein